MGFVVLETKAEEFTIATNCKKESDVAIGPGWGWWSDLHVILAAVVIHKPKRTKKNSRSFSLLL